MNPTNSYEDVNYAVSMVKAYQECSSWVTKAEFAKGLLFVDRYLEIVMHVKAETRGKIYGVSIPFGCYKLTHIATTKKGSAKLYLAQFAEWSGGASIWLFVKTSNNSAIDFYISIGFTKISIVNFKNFSSFIMIRY